MGCAKSKEARAAKRKAKGKSDPGGRMAAKDHLSSQTLPKSSAVVVSGPPSGSASTALKAPRAQARACIHSHPVVIFSRSTCRC